MGTVRDFRRRLYSPDNVVDALLFATAGGCTFLSDERGMLVAVVERNGAMIDVHQPAGAPPVDLGVFAGAAVPT